MIYKCHTCNYWTNDDLLSVCCHMDKERHWSPDIQKEKDEQLKSQEGK